jgi:hypothetical protein
MPTITSNKASNWVDRGEPAGPTLRRILAYLFGKHTDNDARWLGERADTVLGMVAADATEIHIIGYLRNVAREAGTPDDQLPDVRPAAIALWHAAKAALVRDLAERVLNGEIPPNDPTEERLSSWLASKLLTPEELARYEAEANTRRDVDG